MYAYVYNNPLIHLDPTGNVVYPISPSLTCAVDMGNCKSNLDAQVKAGKAIAVEGANFLILDDVNTLMNPDGSLNEKALTLASFLPWGKLLKAEKVVSKGSKAAKSLAKCNCFTAGTKVLTDEGEKDIEDIEVGDKVLSKNEETGEQAYKEVTALHRNEKDTTYKLTVGNQVIETTDNHPFWVESKGWVLAIDLKAGDELVQSNGNYLKIDNIEIVHHDTKVKVYNFTVADFHTYFVSSLGIWVHNIGGCLDWSKAEAHVRKHEINDLTKPSHGIFSGDAVEIVEGAWAKIKDKKIRAQYDSNQKNWYYEVVYNNSGIAGGKFGDGSTLNKVRIVVNNASENRIITAFPK